MTAANDDMIETDLEQAIRACPGPTSGDPWWQRRRHLVMMDFGCRLDQEGRPLWPPAAEYARHQAEFERVLLGIHPEMVSG